MTSATPPAAQRKPPNSGPTEPSLSAAHDTEPKLPSDRDTHLRHLLIELIMSRHENMIDGYLGALARRNPHIDIEAVRSTFLFRLAKACLKKDLLLKLQNEDLQPLIPEKEANIIKKIIDYSFRDEQRNYYRAARKAKSFSQCGDFESGQIPDHVRDVQQEVSSAELASHLAERLQELGVELTDRQFNILLCKLESAQDSTKPRTYEQIADYLKISDTTVKRAVARIREKISQTTNGQDIERVNATTIRRNDYTDILDQYPNLSERRKRYLEVYITLSAEGRPPTEKEQCEMLSITPHQLKRERRLINKLRPTLLGRIS